MIELLPGSMVTADMEADNPGEWLFHSHVADQIDAGMITTYEILPQVLKGHPPEQPSGATVMRHRPYVGAPDETRCEWDVAS